MKLRKCYCGGEAAMIPFDNKYPFDDKDRDPEDLRMVYCNKCDYETMSYWNGNRAYRAWNYLMRRFITRRKQNDIAKK